jgi:hypothetical protein
MTLQEFYNKAKQICEEKGVMPKWEGDLRIQAIWSCGELWLCSVIHEGKCINGNNISNDPESCLGAFTQAIEDYLKGKVS